MSLCHFRRDLNATKQECTVLFSIVSLGHALCSRPSNIDVRNNNNSKIDSQTPRNLKVIDTCTFDQPTNVTITITLITVAVVLIATFFQSGTDC